MKGKPKLPTYRQVAGQRFRFQCAAAEEALNYRSGATVSFSVRRIRRSYACIRRSYASQRLACRSFLLISALSALSVAQFPPDGELGLIEYNPFHSQIKAQEKDPANAASLEGGSEGQDALKCFMLNTAAQRMEPQSFGGSAPKEWTTFGFHAQRTMETQIVLAPSATQYRPLARLPKNDGCAYQANFRAGTNSGCNITGVQAQQVAAGGFLLPDPISNNSHCQLFSSCIPTKVWESDSRHKGDIGAQGQWCSEIGGCWQPATGIRTQGCKCYSDRPLKDWYGPNVQPEPLPLRVDGKRALACIQNWIRVPARDLKTDRVPHHDEQLLIMTSNPDRDEDVSGGSPSWPAYSQPQMIMGGTRCGFFSYGNIAQQHPTGRIIRDKGEGKQENPALLNSHLSRIHGDALEQDSDSFVFRRHPDCYSWNNSTNSSDPISGTIGNAPVNITGACKYDGQVELGAMARSNSGEAQVKTFKTSLNHSVVYTLRITTNERGSSYELLQADGVRLIEAVTHTHRYCHNYALGRNIGLSRLPLTGGWLPSGGTTLDPTCTLMTPIEVCYASDPMTWGTGDRLWRRNSASHAPLPSNFNPRDSPLATRATSEKVKCQVPFCTPSDVHT